MSRLLSLAKGATNYNLSYGAYQFSRAISSSMLNLDRFFKPTHDLTFKKVFTTDENRELLINFINSILAEGGDKQISKIEHLHIEDTPLNEDENKQIILDIYCRDELGEHFIVEMQKIVNSSYLKRSVYYGARKFGSQLEKGEGYNDLKKVYVISVLDQNIFKHDEYLSVFKIMNSEDTDEKRLDYIDWYYLELPKAEESLKDVKDSKHKNLKSWVDFFNHASEHDSIPADASETIKKAYQSVSDKNYTSEETKEIERTIRGKYWTNDLIRTLRKEGREEGREIGREEGKEEGKHLLIIEYLRDMNEDRVIDFFGKSKVEAAKKYYAENPDLFTDVGQSEATAFIDAADNLSGNVDPVGLDSAPERE